MAIDITQFHEVFFAESLENLDTMESGLLAIGPGANDREAIDAIFRAVHSVKGGSATFGFPDVADFAHAIETVLGEIRADRLATTPAAVEALLQAVDTLREMIEAARAGAVADAARVASSRVEMHRLLGVPSPGGMAGDAAEQGDDGLRPAIDRRRGERRVQGDRRGTAAVPTSMRVDVRKIDSLVSRVGDVLLAQSAMTGLVDALDPNPSGPLRDALVRLERHTRELQVSAMQLRMVPIEQAFGRFPRLVHDLGLRLGKSVELLIEGAATEVDRNVIEKIGDPLLHLVRNSLDHGLEIPGQRVRLGKSRTGTLRLSATQQSDHVVIEVSDDGAGLSRDAILERATEQGLVDAGARLSDPQVFDLVFHPGFSTARRVSDLSGRGVGMDVVRRNIGEIGGEIEIASQAGEGTRVTIRLPLGLVVLDGRIVRIGTETCLLPANAVVETRALDSAAAVAPEPSPALPMVHLAMHGAAGESPQEGRYLLVIASRDRRCGLVVDDVVGEQQVIINAFKPMQGTIEGVCGGTVLGDGTLALILDVERLLDIARRDRPPASLQKEVRGGGSA